MAQLSALDAFFLHGDTAKQAMNLSGIGIYRPAASVLVDFPTVVRYAVERTRRSALFRRKLVIAPLLLDQPYWADDENFDVRNHVFHATLPSPGGRAELNAEIARIHAARVSRQHPLWEWWFIDGLETIEGVPPGCFALLFKLHHAAFDGVSAWEVISVSHDTEPGRADEILDAATLPANARAYSVRPSAVEMGMNAYLRAVSQPLRWVQLFWKSVPIAQSMARDASNFPTVAARPPRLSFNIPISATRSHRKARLTLSELKSIRSLAPGATINDAVLAIISGALRRYFASHDAVPKCSLTVGVPISIRAPGGADAAGNQAILAIVSLATNVADPGERMAAIRDATAAKKAYVGTIPAHIITEYVDLVPGIIMAGAVHAFTMSHTARVLQLPYNLIVTNVPASRVPIYFAGAEMIDYDACGPVWDGCGLLHVITSYLDVVNISFDAATNAMPDPDCYYACLVEEIAAISQFAADAQIPNAAPQQ